MAPSGLGYRQLAAPRFGADFVRETAQDAGTHNENKCSGRGERDSPATNDLPITMRLAEPPTSHELVRSADLRARSGLTTEQLIYRGRAAGWLEVPSLEPVSGPLTRDGSCGRPCRPPKVVRPSSAQLAVERSPDVIVGTPEAARLDDER